MCRYCRTELRPYRECPCGRLHRRDSRTCFVCRNNAQQRGCRYCDRPQPGGKTCAECKAALARWKELFGKREQERPPSFAWPEGHLERLAERAAAGLPLFG